MRARSLFVVFFLLTSALFAQEPRLRTRPAGPPALPLPAPFALRGDMVRPQQWHRVAEDTNGPTQETVALPLSAGLTMISLPVRTGSPLLSDILQNLPSGSRVWTWDAFRQQFVEGFDQELRFGDGALLYLPSPAIVTVTGTTDDTEEVPVNLQNGWNLVGVPFDVPVIRSSQYVYVGGLPTDFNDAVNNGDLGPDVFSLDSRGQQSIGETDSLEPMNAYWLYSGDAELLELQTSQTALKLGEGTPSVAATQGNWDGAKAFLSLAQFVASQYLASVNRQKTTTDLAGIAQQITQVQTTQRITLQQMKSLNNELKDILAEFSTQLGEADINTIQSNLGNKYDGGDGPIPNPLSFMWFVTTKQPITDQQKLDFDESILTNGDDDWRVKFNRVFRSVVPENEGSPGVFENYANLVILSDLGDSEDSLETRYKRMEGFFKQVIGMQVKCMLMITNAYDDIWQNPAYQGSNPYTGKEAQDFYTNTYLKNIRQEVNRFRSAVEKVLAGSLIIGTNRYQPAVVIPQVVRDKMMPSADYLTMVLLGEPGGVRLRVLVSPDMNADDTYSLRTLPPGQWTFPINAFCGLTGCPPLPVPPTPEYPLPRTDSTDPTSGWTAISGSTNYDSWKFDNTSKPVFVFSKKWRMYRNLSFGFPPPPSGSTKQYDLYANDAWRITDTRPSLISYGYLDDSGKYSTTGKTLFGSAVIATRASAASILNIPAADMRPSVFANLRTCGTTQANYIGLTKCNVHDLTVKQKLDFMYGGAAKASAYWEMTIDAGQSGGSRARGFSFINLKDGDNVLVGTSTANGTSTSFPTLIEWQPNKTYSLEMGVNYSTRCDFIDTPNFSKNDCDFAVSQSVTRWPVIMQFVVK